jgi:hypothetical protein
MERKRRKRSLGVGSEKMERAGNRWRKIKTYCSTGQSPQRAVAPTEEDEGYGQVVEQEMWRIRNNQELSELHKDLDWNGLDM